MNDHTADVPGRRRALACRVKAFLYGLLADADPRDLRRPLAVRVGDRFLTAAVSVGPAGDGLPDGLPPEFPGSFFSDLEAAAWNALAGKTGLIGKQIARAVGRKGFDSELRIVLRNLVRRGVLTHDRERGYARASLPRQGRGERPKPSPAGAASRPTEAELARRVAAARTEKAAHANGNGKG